MRQEIRTITYYKFSELSEEAQEKAIEGLYDLNVNLKWWDCTYEDAAVIGLEITEFDIDRGDKLNGFFTLSPYESAREILKHHGEGCDTYILAQQLLQDLGKLSDEDSDAAEIINQEYERAIKEEYLSILRKEYEYLTSREAIVESIEAGDFEFTENGEMA